MNSQHGVYVPFAQLSLAEFLLYLIAARRAIKFLYPWSPKGQEVEEYLRRIWDERNYTPVDLDDLGQMADRLKIYLMTYAIKDLSLRSQGDRYGRYCDRTA